MMKWETMDKLFDEVPDDGSINIVLAEFGEEGLEMTDFSAAVNKIFDGRAMHIDSFIENPTHWIKRISLEAFLEQLEH